MGEPAETVVVGRIGRAHGIRGEVSVEPRTDEPERRFAVGGALSARTPDGVVRPPLTVAGIRWHQGRLLVCFTGIADRTTAESVRGTILEVAVDPAESPDDPEEFYDHQLVGLRVDDVAGGEIGTVTGVEHTGAQDLLHIAVPTEAGATRDVLFPFVAALVPQVDLAGGRLIVQDSPGLLREPDPEVGAR